VCVGGSGFGLAVHFNGVAQLLLSACFTLLYGMQANFLINNGMHELGHGTAFQFQTRWLNFFFLRVASFLGWSQPGMHFFPATCDTTAMHKNSHTTRRTPCPFSSRGKTL
jgi:fatty acid desaturase